MEDIITKLYNLIGLIANWDGECERVHQYYRQFALIWDAVKDVVPDESVEYFQSTGELLQAMTHISDPENEMRVMVLENLDKIDEYLQELSDNSL